MAKRSAQGWDRERDRAARTAAEKSRSGRDIGELPPVADADRKTRCGESFGDFCRTYFPDVFNLAWSDDHLRAIGRIETAVREGGLFAYAMPRGSGKTSLAEAACCWALLYGHRRFVLFVGSDEESAAELLDSVRTELETNELLLGDFPEACAPIRALEGIAHRANGQLHQGERTHIGWAAKELVLPTIPGSAASGGILKVTGITGRIRGMKFKRPDGVSVRPDLVVPDDPQTDQSARSPSQTAQRIKVLCGAILGLAGPGKKIAGIMPCTVIEPADMADVILDRQKHPEWQGERTKLIYAWPTDETKWEEYKKRRADGLRDGDGGRAATEYYRSHRDAMDAGSKVAWPARHNADELSALQHAVNLRMDLGEAAFNAEYQNDPQKADAAAPDKLTADQVASKVNGYERRVVPAGVTKIVAFIDVQKPLLPFGVVGFEPGFTGYVLDYGFWPEQAKAYFHRRDVTRTAAVVLKSKSLEETIYQGLKRLTDDLLAREWEREDGAKMKIDRCLVDANWGESTDVVYTFARESPFAGVIVPTHGRYVGAAGRDLNDAKPKKGEERGDHWRRPAVQGKRAVRYGLFDANYYKSFLHARLAVPIGGPGCLSLFGDDPQAHQLLADHVVSEDPIVVEAKGRVVTEFRLPPSKPDNDLLDVLAGCHVAASMVGIGLAERAPQKPPRKARRLKLSEIQRNRSN